MKAIRVITILGVFALAAACSKENTANPNAAPLPPVVVTASPTPPPADCAPNCGTGIYSGSTVALTYEYAALSDLFYNSRPNSPQNVRINFDLRRERDGVIVSYTENGVLHEIAMGTAHPSTGATTSTVNGSQVDNKLYNKWYIQQPGNQTIWKGFFQDYYGAFVVVLDRAVGSGDGQPPAVVGGSVWFQNFNLNYPRNPSQGPEKACWFISLGNHDCRTFLTGNYNVTCQTAGNNPGTVYGQINMLSTVFPTNKGACADNTYRKLGEFDGVDRVQAGF